MINIIVKSMDKKILWYSICILLIILPLAQSQRGGGGGGGGGGGHSGGGGFRGSGSRTRSCSTKCAGDPACIQNCERSGRIAGIVIGSVFGGFTVIGVAVLACKRKLFSCCKWCYCSKYQQLKRQFNIVDQSAMSREEYISKRDKILSMLNSTDQDNSQGFQFEQKGTIYHIKCKSQIVKQQNLLTEIKLDASDNIGAWNASGYILPKDGDIFMWFYKQYHDKQDAGQTGSWSHLVYKSSSYDYNRGMEGSWYYTGYESSDLYSGRWKLEHQVNSPQGNINTFQPNKFM